MIYSDMRKCERLRKGACQLNGSNLKLWAVYTQQMQKAYPTLASLT